MTAQLISHDKPKNFSISPRKSPKGSPSIPIQLYLPIGFESIDPHFLQITLLFPPRMPGRTIAEKSKYSLHTGHLLLIMRRHYDSPSRLLMMLRLSISELELLVGVKETSPLTIQVCKGVLCQCQIGVTPELSQISLTSR